MSENVKSTTDADFEEDVIQSKVPVIVDFWATWCGPCKMVAPVFDDLAKEMNDRVVFMKMDVDQNNETPAKYGVRSIPSLILFKEGNVAGTHVGAVTKSQLAAFIEDNL